MHKAAGSRAPSLRSLIEVFFPAGGGLCLLHWVLPPSAAHSATRPASLSLFAWELRHRCGEFGGALLGPTAPLPIPSVCLSLQQWLRMAGLPPIAPR